MRLSSTKTPRQRNKSQLSPSPRKSIIKQHKIHNQQKLKVFIKFKPHFTQQQRTKQVCVSYLNQKQLQIQTSLNKKIYTFDHVFDPMIDAQSVFNIGCGQLIQEVIEGVHKDKINNNGLVFVYGNTGTGKTHTMGLIEEVNQESEGLVPDALRHIFEDNNTVEQVCMSFCEIYKDQVYDLLDFQEEKKLSIRENQKSKQPFIQDLIMIQVNNFTQASQLLNIGLQKRRIAEQKVNNRSSRGHGIITFYLKNTNSQHTGRISFVDLAGCQRIKQSESKGLTLNQALYINASLSALQTLLMNISDQNVRSYRGNKLTRLLQPYFEFGKIRLFVTSNYESTQSIEFAKRCKGIKFHERQVKRQTQKSFKTPRRTQKADQKMNQKQNQNIEKLKKQFMARQNSYLKCISNLVSIIQKVHENLSTSISKLSIHSSFSLPQLFQHLPLQSKVNGKINIFQKKQQQIIFEDKQDSFSKVSTNISQTISQDINSIFQKIQDTIRSSQQIGFSTIKKISQLTQLTQYKNVYKKQWFTSEIKNGLLQNKNDQFQKALLFLMEQLGKFLSDSNPQLKMKISKKLKQYGILLADDNSFNKNKTMAKQEAKNKNSSTKNKTPQKFNTRKKSQDHGLSTQRFSDIQNQQNENSQQFFNKSRKRSIIYIDED